jgi:hypothetical protein
MSAWTCRQSDGKADQKIVPPRLRTPCWKGPGAESEEKREPASDINTATLDSLKALDPNRPIREADMAPYNRDVRFVPKDGVIGRQLVDS